MRPTISAAIAAACAALSLTACGGQTPNANAVTPAGASPAQSRLVQGFKFKTIVNPLDPTFNRVLGINDKRTAVGYDGNGDSGHPSAGYSVVPPFEKHNFTGESFPGAAQTRVTAINNLGDTAGVWIDGTGAVHGFIEWDGIFTSYDDPAGTATQILGLNDSGIAAGFYTGASDVRYGFTLDRSTGIYSAVSPPGAGNVTAAGINGNGDVVGFYTGGSQTFGFLEISGNFSEFAYPGANVTMALGINARDTIVGSYMDPSGYTHGFVLRNPRHQPKWQSIDHPKGAGTTIINGINDRLNMVGSYVDASGNTAGMLIERKKM